jgi:uncharacterized protein (TIGR02996 family)
MRIPDETPELQSLLWAAYFDQTAMFVLADWLEERGDERADAMREIAEIGPIGTGTMLFPIQTLWPRDGILRLMQP